MHRIIDKVSHTVLATIQSANNRNGIVCLGLNLKEYVTKKEAGLDYHYRNGETVLARSGRIIFSSRNRRNHGPVDVKHLEV